MAHFILNNNKEWQEGSEHELSVLVLLLYLQQEMQSPLKLNGHVNSYCSIPTNGHAPTPFTVNQHGISWDLRRSSVIRKQEITALRATTAVRFESLFLTAWDCSTHLQRHWTARTPRWMETASVEGNRCLSLTSCRVSPNKLSSHIFLSRMTESLWKIAVGDSYKRTKDVFHCPKHKTRHSKVLRCAINSRPEASSATDGAMLLSEQCELSHSHLCHVLLNTDSEFPTTIWCAELPYCTQTPLTEKS